MNNNRALVSGDISMLKCNPLPKSVSEVPGEHHPLNDVLRCGKRICDIIPGSELPWCPIGADRTGTACFRDIKQCVK